MPRPPLQIGTYGNISRTETQPGRWVARCRFRDFDGRTRKVEAWGTSGAAATRNLKAALADRAIPGESDVAADTRLSVLWDVYRAALAADGAALRTIQTYDYVATRLLPAVGEWRIREATTQHLERTIKALRAKHGVGLARSARAVLSGMFRLAVQYGAASANPVRETSAVKSDATPARSLTRDELYALIEGVRQSAYARRADLVALAMFLAATGVRIGEALAVRWSDLDLEAGTVTVTGHVVRVKGQGLRRIDGTKANQGRVLALPAGAVAMLMGRKVDADANMHDVVFPSTTGRLRDVDSVTKQWRKLRGELGFRWVTTHTFRKTLLTLFDDEGLSARVAADQAGHASPSMTQDVYMGRGQQHPEALSVLNSMFARFESGG